MSEGEEELEVKTIEAVKVDYCPRNYDLSRLHFARGVL